MTTKSKWTRALSLLAALALLFGVLPMSAMAAATAVTGVSYDGVAAPSIPTSGPFIDCGRYMIGANPGGQLEIGVPGYAAAIKITLDVAPDTVTVSEEGGGDVTSSNLVTQTGADLTIVANALTAGTVYVINADGCQICIYEVALIKLAFAGWAAGDVFSLDITDSNGGDVGGPLKITSGAAGYIGIRGSGDVMTLTSDLLGNTAHPDVRKLTASYKKDGGAETAWSGSGITFATGESYEVTLTFSDIANTAPVAKSPFPVTVKKGTTATFTSANIATDADADEIKITAVKTPPDSATATAALNSAGAVTVTGMKKGPASVVVTVADNYGGSVDVTVPVTVENSAPEVKSVSVNVDVGKKITLEASALTTDADGDAMTVTAITTAPDAAKITAVVVGGKLEITGVAATGTNVAPMVVTVSDGTATATVTVNVSSQIVYVVEQNPGAWNGSGTAVGKITGDLADFVKLQKDGVDVAPSNYEATSGSVIITFKESYLKSLGSGAHVFRAVFNDGYANLTMNVAATGSSNDTGSASTVPATGDGSNPVLWSAMLLLPALAVWLLRRRQNSDR